MNELQIYKKILGIPLDSISVFQEYIDKRLEALRISLEREKDIGEVRELQGQIKELRQLKKIRDIAVQTLKGT